MPFDKGRDRHTAQHQDARRRLRKGIAKVALHQHVTGKPKCDAYGYPLTYAKEMADRHSISTVEKWAKGSGLTPGLRAMSLTVDPANPKAATWPR